LGGIILEFSSLQTKNHQWKDRKGVVESKGLVELTITNQDFDSPVSLQVPERRRGPTPKFPNHPRLLAKTDDVIGPAAMSSAGIARQNGIRLPISIHVLSGNRVYFDTPLCLLEDGLALRGSYRCMTRTKARIVWILSGWCDFHRETMCVNYSPSGCTRRYDLLMAIQPLPSGGRNGSQAKGNESKER